MDGQLNHDKMCFDQTAEIATLKEKIATNSDDIGNVVNRVNEEIKTGSKRDEQFGRLDERLRRIESDVKAAADALKDEVTKKEDFLTLRNQVWGAVAIIMLLFLTSLFYAAMRQQTPPYAAGPAATQGAVK